LGHSTLKNFLKKIKIYLIDYGEVGRSHFLKDFISLEAYIRFVLMGNKEAAEADRRGGKFKKEIVEKWVGMEKYIKNPQERMDNTLDNELKKAIYSIESIRKIAKELRKERNLPQYMDEYYKGLLYYSLLYLTFDIKETKKEYAAKLASLIITDLKKGIIKNIL
jgi:hypothetical protein